jgi:uncharacterized membrane protein
MVSDFIHIQIAPMAQIVYYALAFSSIIFSALVLGFVSLYLIHQELKKRLTEFQSTIWVAATILTCSIAIYIGRDLRWNSWDVLFNPGGIIFDINNQITHLSLYPHAISTTGMFFVLLSSIYFLAISGIKLFSEQ